MEYKYELHCHTGAVSRCGRVEPEKMWRCMWMPGTTALWLRTITAP